MTLEEEEEVVDPVEVVKKKGERSSENGGETKRGARL